MLKSKTLLLKRNDRCKLHQLGKPDNIILCFSNEILTTRLSSSGLIIWIRGICRVSVKIKAVSSSVADRKEFLCASTVLILSAFKVRPQLTIYQSVLICICQVLHYALNINLKYQFEISVTGYPSKIETRFQLQTLNDLNFYKKLKYLLDWNCLDWYSFLLTESWDFVNTVRTEPIGFIISIIWTYVNLIHTNSQFLNIIHVNA